MYQNSLGKFLSKCGNLLKKFFPSGLAEKAENLTIKDNFYYSTDGILFEFYNQKSLDVHALFSLDF